jgi:serine/threonine protein kinase
VTDFGDTQVQGDDELEDSRQLSLQDHQPPAEVDGYTMIRRLGTGGYGTVWLAREDNTGRMVAIKYYPHRRGINWSLLSREVEKLAKLYTSRNIVQLLDVGWNAEPPYYVMEFVENGPLSGLMARGSMDTSEAVRIAKEICRALIEAHGAGVLHCDLKPDNVLLDSQSQVRLCDFGQSRMSHERSPALGTLYYMAPEQADLEAVADARWDVYAVGALLYHLLTGAPPYRSPELQQQLEETKSLDERLELYRRAIRTSPRPTKHHSIPGVDRRLSRLIDACLTVDPADRLPNAQVILAELNTRDRLRSRRPLLLLGVLGPLLLIAAMVPIFANALQRNLDEMEHRLTYRALESDALSARALAGALEAELQGRLSDLQEVLANEQIIQRLEFLDDGKSSNDYLQAQRLIELDADTWPEWMKAFEKDELQLLLSGGDAALVQQFIDRKPEARPAWMQPFGRGKTFKSEELLKLLEDGDSALAVARAWSSHELPLDDQPDWMQEMERARSRADMQTTLRNHKPDTSWFLQDIHGNQIWRRPFVDTVSRNWAYRDYFHGRNQTFTRNDAPDDLEPIQSPHVSLPFTSQATGQYMVALSVPVRNSSNKVVGILARTVHLADLRERLGEYLRDSQDPLRSDDPVIREVALADARTGEILDHPWLNTRTPEQLAEVFHDLVLPAETMKQLQVKPALLQDANTAHTELLLKDYDDPVGQIKDPTTVRYATEWIASMARMSHLVTPWIVIVQEQKANIVRPVDDMKSKASRTAGIAILTSVLLMVIVWGFVARAMNRSA